MVGVELLTDGRPDAAMAGSLVTHCRDVGKVLLMTAGSDANVVRWMPPLVVTEPEIETGVEAFAAALANGR
jgi:4-aminobutyrate aminotransferase-like enzyme